ncbi:MAG TPA: glycosyltransferase family 2 protein [Candidatus Methylomirabilis sp.]|nr:glycosyltransferase family 2 protein [Candidatus Methylomirabilis sp.]
MSGEIQLSIVLPVHNEVESLPVLWRELAEVLPGLGEPAEVIFVDDGSTDGSVDVLHQLAEGDPRIRLIRFDENAGLSAAFYAGLQAARGHIIATMDSDLQNDPRDIGMLISHLGTADAVVGWRHIRRDSWLKRISSLIANGIRKAITGDRVHDTACSLRVMRRECVTAVPPFTGMHRFMPTLLRIAGFHVVQVPVNHRERRFGRSKFGVADRAFSAFADLLAVRWMMGSRLRYKIVERIDPPGENGP